MRIDHTERRARLARRHGLAPGERAGDVVEAARSLVCLHATDPVTVYLSAWARVDGMAVADLERALYEERSLVKHLAMRRTLFVFPRETLAAAQAGASERVAVSERRKVVKDVEAAGLQRDGERWLRRAVAAITDALADGREATMAELRDELPLLQGETVYGEGKSWGGSVPIAPRVLTVASAEGRIVRATNQGRWTVSRHRWSSMEAWLGEGLVPPPAANGVAALVAAWLRAFGPGTAADIKWWLGSTMGAVRAALPAVGAVEVELDGGATGYVLPDDLEPAEPVEPWIALLPPLDPTTMAWSERDWYLGHYKAQLFDRAGNAGPTMWADGRIVGGWRQREDGTVELQPLEDVGAERMAAFEREGARLTEWLGETRVLPRFPTPLSKALAG